MCMAKTPEVKTPAPAPTAPPVLEQVAPKSAGKSDSDTDRKRKGTSKYKLPQIAAQAPQTNKLGGIPKKTGTG